MSRVKDHSPNRSRYPRYGRLWHLVAAAAAVAVITALIHLLPGAVHITNISLLYLLAVIGTALRFGRASAVAASVLSFLAFDFFFVEPRHTFTVRDPAEWLALCMFLLTATVTGQLTALLRARADDARQREREAEALAEASWAVASQVDRSRALAAVLRRLSDVVGPEDAAIVVREDADQLTSLVQLKGESGRAFRLDCGAAREAVEFVLQHGHSIGWEGDRRNQAPAGVGQPDAVYLPLTTESRVLGVLYLRLPEGQRVSRQQRRVVESLANHAAVVLERDRLARAETQARALAEADRLKTALLSMVSHDFRSPLATIKTSATALLEGGTPMDGETHRELAAGIDQEADRLNRMVGNILALSRLEADAWRPRWEATDPAEMIGAALQAFSSDQNRRIDVRLDANLDEAWLDPAQIVQVLHNLVDNALKYSPVERRVELVMSRQEEWLVVEVLDRGPGLPPGDEERIFERFYRSPSLRESAVPGVGIGLAVCRGLVEAHGGQLTAGNRDGGGAVFRFTLPLRPPEATFGRATSDEGSCD